MRNKLTVVITVPNQMILQRLNSTPALKLSRITLKVGMNTEVVNHAQFASMQRMYPLVGVGVSKIN
jgi:hypothetical protein